MLNPGAPCYVAFGRCGCPIAAIIDNRFRHRAIAAEVAKWIRAGFKVERRSVRFARENLGRCRHRESPRPTAPPARQRPLGLEP
jgi:hypothetical protein